VYQKSRTFDTLQKNLAKAVADIAATAEGEVAYCVDGAASEDNSVRVLLKRFGHSRVEIIDGVSRIGALVRLAEFQECSYMAISAYEMKEYGAERLTAPLIAYDMDDRGTAGDVKLILSDAFGEETDVWYLVDGTRKKIKLYELDRQESYNYSSAVAVERADLLDKKRYTLADLKDIVVRLRRPDGCAWDKVQTPESIKMNVVEEAYELLDAIDSGDDDKVLEETGDILLQATFHAVMKEETGAFDLTDVCTGICEKLITRHTHIFGKDKAENEEGALSIWEKNKMKEKHHETFADAVNDVPKCFPAAMRAQKVGKRAAKSGFEFADVKEAALKVEEELDEFRKAYEAGDGINTEKEAGDLLFAAVNVGRMAGCDCEKALKESTDKFARRFTETEKLARADGKDVTTLTEQEWDEYYRAAKKALLEEGK
jgi:tetrapyrrole methylase family protein/MazG family protein